MSESDEGVNVAATRQCAGSMSGGGAGAAAPRPAGAAAGGGAAGGPPARPGGTNGPGATGSAMVIDVFGSFSDFRSAQGVAAIAGLASAAPTRASAMVFIIGDLHIYAASRQAPHEG